MTTKTRPRQTTATARRDVVLDDDACSACGSAMKKTRARLAAVVNGEEVAVSGIEHLKCPDCGEVLLGYQSARRLGEDAAAKYREKYGLLSADEIRGLRRHFGLTQRELARLLRLGANTISRWESGRNVQTAAMDLLLRLVRDIPGSIEYLREHAA